MICKIEYYGKFCTVSMGEDVAAVPKWLGEHLDKLQKQVAQKDSFIRDLKRGEV